MPHTITPIDSRIYVNPSGERCRLVIGRAAGPGGALWWSVELLSGRGMSPIAGQPAVVEMHRTREEARAAYRQRSAALRAEAWKQAHRLESYLR